MDSAPEAQAEKDVKETNAASETEIPDVQQDNVIEEDMNPVQEDKDDDEVVAAEATIERLIEEFFISVETTTEKDTKGTSRVPAKVQNEEARIASLEDNEFEELLDRADTVVAEQI